jgi:long-chain acyl-CoA synthetase
MLLHGMLERTAQRAPDKPAVESAELGLTYGELDRQSAALAASLQRLGIMRGDRVALFMRNRAEMAVSIFAVLKAGAVFMPVSPQIKPEKLAYILDDSGARALITETRLGAVYHAAARHCPTLEHAVVVGAAETDTAGGLPVYPYEEMVEGFAKPVQDGLIDQDLAAIIYTSGSTGDPKGVTLSHLNMVTACRSVSTYLGLEHDDRVFCALPLSFDYGLYQVLMAARVGATVVLEQSFTFPHQALQQMSQQRCTVFPGVPTMFSMVARLDLDAYNLDSVRLVTNTAAALSRPLISEIRMGFPKATLFSMYGLTECKRVSYLPPEELERRPDSVGRGMPNQEVYLVDEQGRRLPNGSIGELVVRGSHVMRGYWGKPEATAERLRPGPTPGETVLYTGDIFETDEEGFLYFVGRKDDIIKCKGEKVSPVEVERIISRMDGVLDAAVIGVPDRLLGEAVKAFVAVGPECELTGADIQRFCRMNLEGYMVPTSIELRAELPKTPNGKIAKHQLARQAESESDLTSMPGPA